MSRIERNCKLKITNFTIFGWCVTKIHTQRLFPIFNFPSPPYLTHEFVQFKIFDLLIVLFNYYAGGCPEIYGSFWGLFASKQWISSSLNCNNNNNNNNNDNNNQNLHVYSAHIQKTPMQLFNKYKKITGS